MISRRIVIKYPPRLVDKPVLCRLVRDHNLDFNILRAQVTPESGGLMVLEVSGEHESYEGAMKNLEAEGISTQLLSTDVRWEKGVCTQCGVCVSLCPSGALSAHRETQRVDFDAEKCVACEHCIVICPVQALRVQF